MDGRQEHTQGALFIGDLTARAHARPVRNPRFEIEDEGNFDLRATAFSMGMTVKQLERRPADRRRQTAMMAYLLGAFGLIFFGGWMIQLYTPAIHMTYDTNRPKG